MKVDFISPTALKGTLFIGVGTSLPLPNLVSGLSNGKLC